jgi:hypothetical protein
VRGHKAAQKSPSTQQKRSKTKPKGKPNRTPNTPTIPGLDP